MIQWLAPSPQQHKEKVLVYNWGLSGYFKLPVCVTECEWLCVSPATDWLPAQGVPFPFAQSQLGTVPASLLS